MGVDFAIMIEPRSVDVSGITDAELVAYHRDHCPPGSPPLDAIRDHVARAIARDRAGRANEPDPTEALHSAFVDAFGRNRFWWDDDLTAAAARVGVTPLADFVSSANEPRWSDAAAGVKTVQALRAFLAASDPQSPQMECLVLLEQILLRAAAEERQWWVLAMR